MHTPPRIWYLHTYQKPVNQYPLFQFHHVLQIYTRKCTTLWSEPDPVHAQNMEQLHAFDCHQNVAEPQATENHIKYTHVYTVTVSQT